MDIRVVIFEDRKLIREAFEAIVNGTPGLTCAGSFSNASDLIHNIKKTSPDVVLMDVEMPGIDGITAAKMILSKFPGIKILIQTVFDDDDKVFNAICAGASGYVMKNTTPAKLVDSIIEVYNGGAPMSPSIAAKVLTLFQKIAPSKSRTEDEEFHLSKREKEILALMVEGHSFKIIAEKNFIGYETVRTHVKKIYQKLHVASQTEAVVKAIKHGLI